MEADRSIVLQKKTILFLSLVIGAIFGVIYGREVKIKETEIYLTNLDLVTVNVSEDENEILRENVKYLATKVIVEDNLSVTEINDQKIEAFAGDVTSLVDEKENDNVANNESINEVEAPENVEENTENEKQEILEEEKETEVENIEVEQTEIINNITNNNEQIQKEEVNIVETKIEKPKTVRYRDLAENNPPTEYLRVVEANATAYCLCKKCCGKSPDHPYYGYTHSGIKIEQGSGIKVIAVDPKVIPLNSKVYVEGLYGAWDYGHAIAADTGSAIKELKIDLYMDTHEEALQWGRKKVKVYVLGE